MPNHHPAKRDSGRQSELRIGVGSPRADDVEPPVSVFSRPVVEERESSMGAVHANLWPHIGHSVVRLYRLDDEPTLLREWAELPTGLLEIFGAATDRKLQLALIGGRVLSAFEDGGPVHARIESAAKLVQEFTEFEAETRRQGLISWLHPESPCPIVVYVQDRSVNVVFDKTVPDFGEGYAVGFRPFDALPTTGKTKVSVG